MGVLEFRVAEGNVIMINEIRLEQYLAGVLTAEMSGDCPHEYLMAHAVMSRSWLLASARSFHPEEPYAWCNDDCCQRYQGTGDLSSAVAAAVSATHGQILVTSSGRICRASFSKNSGGITENPQSVWGVPTPGLTARFDGPDGAPEIRFFPISEANIREYLCGPWLKETQLYAAPNLVPADQLAEMLAQFNAEFSGFRWRIESTAEELRETVQASGEIKDLDVLKDIELGRRGASGRLEEILLTYRNKKGKLCRKRIASEYRIRRALRAGFLPSSAFVIGMTRNIRGHIKAATFHGAGWVHGVGLCQIGALGRALSGQSYRQILSAYYSDVCIQQIYS